MYAYNNYRNKDKFYKYVGEEIIQRERERAPRYNKLCLLLSGQRIISSLRWLTTPCTSHC